MKELEISKNDAGQRLDRFIGKAVPLLPASLIQKYIRIKRIKVCGKGAKRDYKLAAGDTVQLYVSDGFFDAAKHEFISTARHADNTAYTPIPGPDIIYEDENILLLNKKAGVLCYNSDNPDCPDLISMVKQYLYEKNEWLPNEENCFAPAVCNRIDRNTSGIVIAAKNAESLRIINEKLRTREIDKYYLAAVHGTPEPSSGVLKGYITKNSARNIVSVTKDYSIGAKEAHTEYKTLASSENRSLLECRLITGRTHQIRAQLSDFGHPILGDRKYGSSKQSGGYTGSHQALCSYKIVFSFQSDAGLLSYLKNQSYEIHDIPFAGLFEESRV